jgi:hypothetical protein
VSAWTVTQDDRLREMWERGDTCDVIGAEFSCSATWVSKRAQELNLPPRRQKRSPMWGDDDLRYLRVEAERRGISTYMLRTRIIQVVLRDRMIDAVLDDQKEPWPESAAKGLSDYQKANGRPAT